MLKIKSLRHIARKIALFTFTLFGISLNQYANSTSSLSSINTDIATTGRYYFNEFNKTNTVKNQNNFGVKADVKFTDSYERLKFKSHLFSSWNNSDKTRQYIDIREASISFKHDELSISAGIDTFFWGVTESVNVVNVLNQSDIVESLDGKAKLGQPFFSLNSQIGDSDVTFYYFPLFREQNFPERPSYGLPVSDDSIYENSKRRGGVAARSIFYIDAFEFSLSYFKGTRRTPLLQITPSNPYELTPHYFQTQNLMFDGVYLAEYFTLKLETKLGREQSDSFTFANIGIEYPSYVFSKYIEEIIFIAEYVVDDRGYKAETHGQNDIFLGARFEFGSTNNSNIRVLYSYDFDYEGQYVELNYQYRLNDYFRIKTKIMKVLYANQDDLRLFPLKGEEFVDFSLHYAF